MPNLYEIKYASVNEYEEPVNDALFEYLVLPCNDATQTVRSYAVKNSLGDEPFLCRNSYGFETIRIRPSMMFKQLHFTFTAAVEKTLLIVNPYEQVPLEEQLRILDAPVFFIENHLFLSRTGLTSLSQDSNEGIYTYKRDISVLDYLDKLNAYIHKKLSYKQNVTTVKTTAEEVLKTGRGVCQDYAHLFIAMARKNEIPCRYVSGYLDQGAGGIGSAMMHAWVEAYVPGLDWVGLDPTNNIRVDDLYIKVCHGRDYNDCSTIRGVLHTHGENKTSHEVYVAQQ